MIVAIFFAKFHHNEGTRVIHQSPPGCIVAQEGFTGPQLLNFEAVSEFVIPRQAFCNRYITVIDPSGNFRILGFPVCIKNEKYERNEFIFNFVIVTSVTYQQNPYESVVRKLASTFSEMEIQTQFLSQESSEENQKRRSIGALLEIIREDMNNYNECMIPIDGSNTINMKLFPIHNDPPPIRAWHVPIFKIQLDDMIDERWDLTMRKVIPEIDGISDVLRISQKANVALDLTILALQHLVYYKTILIIDTFYFSNIYCLTPMIDDFVNNADNLQEECAAYVFTSRPKDYGFYLCRLFAAFQQGRTLKEWIKIHMDDKLDIMNTLDIRKLVQFGVIKLIIRRVFKYPVSSQYLAGLVTGESDIKEGGDPLQKYTDGCHTFDQIIVETGMTDAEATKKLSKLPSGDVQILYR